MPETNGSGVAFLDYDGDGDQDLFFVNSRTWNEAERAAARRTLPPAMAPYIKETPARVANKTGALYRNNSDGTFTDVTTNSGLDVSIYGMGAAVGDYDNDGRPDLYVTAYPRNYLFHNEGQKTDKQWHFREVSSASGVQGAGWGMCTAWVDYDKDGLLDLFAGRYIQWSPTTDIYQPSSKGRKGYSNPQSYHGQTNNLYRNLGGGRFQDVTRQAGIALRRDSSGESKPLNGKAMGVAVGDFNNDSWPDLIVANDTERNYLFENKGNGTFEEKAEQAGIAHDQFGRNRAGMGVDTADIDHSNRDSVVIGNFSREMLGLYYNAGQGAFVDMAPESEVGTASREFLTFGCLFFDYDNDGWPDILAANGHVQPDISLLEPENTHAQRPLLLRNYRGSGPLRFQEVGLQSGAGMQKKIVARGLASGDLDLDGDVDVVFTVNGGAPLLLRNEGGNRNDALRLVLQGSRSNRSGIGALVKVKMGNDVSRLWVRSGSSFLSQSELPLTIGLGQQKSAEGIAILWPSGAKTTLENVKGSQMIVVDEAKGLIEQKPFPRRVQ